MELTFEDWIIFESGYDIEDYYDLLDNLEEGKATLSDYLLRPDFYDLEAIYLLQFDIDYWKAELAQMRRQYKEFIRFSRK